MTPSVPTLPSLFHQLWDYYFCSNFSLGVQFVLPTLSWNWGLHWYVASLPEATSHKNRYFRSYQFLMATQSLVFQLCPPSKMRFCMVGTCLGLRPIVTITVSVDVYLPRCLENTSFVIIHYLWFLVSSCSLFCRDAGACGEECDVSVQFRIEGITFFVICILAIWKYVSINFIYCKKLFWWGLRDELIYGCDISH